MASAQTTQVSVPAARPDSVRKPTNNQNCSGRALNALEMTSSMADHFNTFPVGASNRGIARFAMANAVTCATEIPAANPSLTP